MQSDRSLLTALTHIILDDIQDGKTLRPEILGVKDIFDRICSDFKQGESFIEFGEVLTPQGLAISPVMAAMCLEDYYRTIIYLRGLNAAIVDLKTQHPTRPLRVLYAGTGPYAILAIPLMSVHSSDCVRFELLDINAVSLDAVRSIVTQLGFTESVTAYHQMDAMQYKHNEAASPDIIIAEIMLAGLEKEPQVAVTRALTTQMPEALFLPQSINISAVTDNPRHVLGPVFQFDSEMFSETVSQEGTLPAATLEIPESAKGHILLETRVKVYQGYELKPYDSGLTSPRILPVDYDPGETLKLVYQMGEKPGLIRAL
ncbi:MAG: nicotianamine synthase family protein [Hellea sp.]